LDNYSAHNVSGALDSIFVKGVIVKLMWSKVKSILRKLKARTFDEL